MKYLKLQTAAALSIAASLLTAVSVTCHAAGDAQDTVIKVVAKKFSFSPKEIKVKKGTEVTLEFTTLDRSHGFKCPAMHLRTAIEPGKVSTLKFTPKKSGTFDFFCDIYCGSGHSDMDGTLKVTD